MGKANIPGRHYEVGKRKPPKQSRFKKGQSGNPKGRPKGTKDPDKLISSYLSKKISVTRKGRAERVTRREALIDRLFMEAAKGNAAVARLLLDRDGIVAAEAQQSVEAEESNKIGLAKLLIQLLEAAQSSSPEALDRTIRELKKAPDMEAPRAVITALFGLGPKYDPTTHEPIAVSSFDEAHEDRDEDQPVPGPTT